MRRFIYLYVKINGPQIETYSENHLYACHFKGERKNVLRTALDFWTDLNEVHAYLEANRRLLQSDYWRNCGLIGPDLVDTATLWIYEDALELNQLLDERIKQSKTGKIPDLDSLFKDLEITLPGKTSYYPVKAYGTRKPSMLRLYALQLYKNCYIIAHGGIKLTKEIQQTPNLYEQMGKRITTLHKTLVDIGISTVDEIKTLNSYED